MFPVGGAPPSPGLRRLTGGNSNPGGGRRVFDGKIGKLLLPKLSQLDFDRSHSLGPQPSGRMLAWCAPSLISITAEMSPSCVYLQGPGHGRPCGVPLPLCVPGEPAGGKCLYQGLPWKRFQHCRVLLLSKPVQRHPACSLITVCNAKGLAHNRWPHWRPGHQVATSSAAAPPRKHLVLRSSLTC